MGRTADEYLERNPRLLTEDLTTEEGQALGERFGALLARWFRLETRGFSRIPEGACLVVCNHSAGALWEVFLLLHAWRRHFGARPARGLAHRIAWQPPFDRIGLQKIGAVFAHPEVAMATLARGAAVLVFPGGDVETARPFGDRYRVTFAGRSGFVRIAREAGVPIVPLVICGSHASYLSLPLGTWVARAFRTHRLVGAKAWPVTAGLAALAATLVAPPLWPLAPLALAQAVVPLPSKMVMEALGPIDAGAEDDSIAALQIERIMQDAMTRLASERTTPWG
jgi:1-acyl-sn-glycerol-3-phosphate acyltransferase